MNQRWENQVVEQHLICLKCHLPLLEDAIPAYIKGLPMTEQQVLLRRARKWLWRYWDKRTQSLRHAQYLASVGQYNEETLCAYFFLANYACGSDSHRVISAVRGWSERQISLLDHIEFEAEKMNSNQ